MPADLFPIIQPTPQFGPRKFPAGFAWGVLWLLPVPAPGDGHIFQEMVMTEGGPTTPTQTVRFMEAWPVARGDLEVAAPRMSLAAMLGSAGSGSPAANTPFNDFFLRKFALGDRGFKVIRSSAAFYKEPLPAGFVTNNPATGALGLPSRVVDARNPVPPFWNGLGFARILWFEFDFTTSIAASSATLRTLSHPVGKVEFGVNPDPSLWTTWP